MPGMRDVDGRGRRGCLDLNGAEFHPREVGGIAGISLDKSRRNVRDMFGRGFDLVADWLGMMSGVGRRAGRCPAAIGCCAVRTRPWDEGSLAIEDDGAFGATSALRKRDKLWWRAGRCRRMSR